LVGDFDATIDLVERYGRREGGDAKPKVYYLTTELANDMLVMPKDYYFISVLAFVHGLDGYGTWTTGFKQDARYLREHARANTLIRFHEDAIRTGTRVNDLDVQLESPRPDASRPFPVYSASFVRNGEALENGGTLIALGNDSTAPASLRLRLPGRPPGKYLLKDGLAGSLLGADGGAGFSADDLNAGIPVQLDAKGWRILELIRSPEGSEADLDGGSRPMSAAP
jgi:hypothetical protein